RGRIGRFPDMNGPTVNRPTASHQFPESSIFWRKEHELFESTSAVVCRRTENEAHGLEVGRHGYAAARGLCKWTHPKRAQLRYLRNQSHRHPAAAARGISLDGRTPHSS